MNKLVCAALAAVGLLAGGPVWAKEPAKKLNVLAVCAHPDDPEILCGGTLLKYRKQGHNVFIVLTTSGLPGKNQQASEKPCTKKVAVFTCLPGAGIDFQPEAYVNITDEVEDKLRALACHKSQLSYMADFGMDEFIERNRVIPAFYGIQAGCKYAEGFKAFRISGYMPDYKVLP